MRFFKTAFNFYGNFGFYEMLKNYYKRDVVNEFWNEERNVMCVISEIGPSAVIFLAAVKDNTATPDEIKQPMHLLFELLRDIYESQVTDIRFDGEYEELQEITLPNFKDIFCKESYSRDVLGDRKFLLERVGLKDRYNILDESIYQQSDIDEEELETFFDKREMERIHKSSANSPDTIQHPVNYLILDEAESVRENLLADLLYLLYKDGLVKNRRNVRVVVGSTYKSLLDKPVANLINIDGGVLIVDVIKEEVDFPKLFKWINPFLHDEYTNNVLVIVMASESLEKRIDDALRKEFSESVFYPVRMREYDYKEASDFFKSLLDLEGVKAKKKQWIGKFDKDRKYRKSEIRRLFNQWFRNEYLVKKYFPHYEQSIEDYYGDSTSGDALGLLEDLIGLYKVKEQVKDIIAYQIVESMRKSSKGKGGSVGLNMMFLGNPGTAKTTVARLYSRILFQAGVLKSGELVEVGRADLVGKYVGWTAKAVKECFEKAKGSVLFIDEAYSLCDDSSGSFGDEAINTLVYEMENHREETVVILAGYKNEMKNLTNKNPGLKSRIQFTVDFDDYDDGELYEILINIAKKDGFTIDSDVRRVVLEMMYRPENVGGNGRSIRNIYEKAKIRQASRILAHRQEGVSDDLWTLEKEDFRFYGEK